MAFYEYVTESVDDDMFFLEATGTSYMIRDSIYPVIEAILKTPDGDRRFRKIIGEFIDRNNAKLHTAGPQYMIAFTDRDKQNYYELFKLDPNSIKKTLKEALNLVNNQASWRLILDNPIYTVFFCVNRYYAKVKDAAGLNLSLAAMALAMYPSMFHKYFPYEPNPEIMRYTIDNLSNKFIIKKTNHIFGLLMATIQQCYKFHEKMIADGSDASCVNYIMRIRNAYNSSMKKIASEFHNNHKKNLTVHTSIDAFDDNAVVDVENDTNKVDVATLHIVNTLLTSGVDLRLAEAAARGSQVSVSDVRNYLHIIVQEEHMEEMSGFIESIIFLFLYQMKKSIRDINTKAFLEFCLALYKKTNSNDKNILNIKGTLDKWAQIVGLNKSFSREATLINYKRALYMFFVLAIQKYN